MIATDASASPGSSTHAAPDPAGPFRFEAAIPLVTNPWIWVDMAKVLGIVYSLLLGLMFWILRDEPWSDVWPAWRVVTLCVLAVLVLLLVASIVVFRNRIVARFTLDDRGATYESGTATARVATLVGLLSLNPLVAGSGLLAESQSALFLPWRDVRKVTVFPGWKVITLSNRWRPVLRLYCIDGPTFERAHAVVASHAAGPHRR